MKLSIPFVAAFLLSSLLYSESIDTNETNKTVETNASIFSTFSDKVKQAKDNVIKAVDNKMDEWMPHEFNGNWHLRIIDGRDTRYARAIIELDLDKLKLSGFDACNQITGDIKESANESFSVPTVKSTWMTCREQIHLWTSRTLHETLKEGFTIKEAKQSGMDGIIIKSKKHELFFKKMGVEEENEEWSSSFNDLFKKKEETPKQN